MIAWCVFQEHRFGSDLCYICDSEEKANKFIQKVSKKNKDTKFYIEDWFVN
jgi:hypothetical protein